MRILDKGQALLTLDDQGFLPDVLERYEASYRKPYGTILVTGPTGSGKSTTLYATLNILNERRPQHHHGRGPGRVPAARASTRCRSTRKAGLSFAAALRSILRADPDIVLVGEIRDQETATIAIEAALTGHLVLTTLHTNDAASTPLRLVEMGVEPFLVTSALDCVLAQRLARRLCDRCAEPYQPSEAELVEAGWPMDIHAGLADAVPGGRLRAVRQDRLQGPVRPPRGDLGHRGDRAAHHRAPIDRRREEDGGHAGDGPAARRRAPQGRRRADQPRRGLPGRWRSAESREEHMSIEDLLRRTVEMGASDLHLKSGRAPTVRVDGTLEALPEPPLTAADSGGDRRRADAGVAPGGVRDAGRARLRDRDRRHRRFRVNVYRQQGNVALAIRYVVPQVPTHRRARAPADRDPPRGRARRSRARHRLDRLGQEHDARVDDRAHQPHPRRARRDHRGSRRVSATIEQRCLISQREIGQDTESFRTALEDGAAPGPRRDPHRRDPRRRRRCGPRSPPPRPGTSCSRRCTPRPRPRP